MMKLNIVMCMCLSCNNIHKCDFYQMACKGADCTKCTEPMKHGECCDYERKVN